MSKKKRVNKIPPRPAAGKDFYDLFLKEKRPRGYSKTNWSRSRLAITTMRYLGLRSSEAGLVKVQELESLIEGSDELKQVYQPKVDRFRFVLVPEEAVYLLLTEHKEDLSLLKAVHEGNSGITLSASCQGKTKGSPLSVRDWSTGLNQVLHKIAKKKGFKGITTHCFRINYISRLLTQLPIQKVQKIVGHRDIKTTAVYDRFDFKDKSLLSTISQVLDTKAVSGARKRGMSKECR